MPRICFIIGNGLDLSLGLKTSYKDFYEFVSQTKSVSENKIYNAIRKDIDTWADFEASLGEYTNFIEKLPKKEIERTSIELHEELEEIRNDLADYLSTQENSIENLPDKYYLNGNGFFSDLPSGQAEIIRNYLGNSRTIAHFVTLNYTTTLEKILENRTLQNQLGWSVTTPLHIHGDIVENMTIGVSAESQLFSGMTKDEKDDLIKPISIKSMNDGRLEKFDKIIKESSIVIIFGSSLGSTDAYIWKFLTLWLKRGEDRRIIIHKHDRKYVDTTRRSPRKQKQYIKNVQSRLLDFSDYDENTKDELRERIFVIHNSKKLFVQRQV